MFERTLVCSALLLACHAESPAVSPGVPPKAASPESASAVEPGARLPESVRPLGYGLELTIAPEAPDFKGHVHIELEVTSPVESILLFARALVVERASVTLPGAGGSRLAVARPLDENGLTAFDLAEPIGPGGASLDIDYSGKLDEHLRGLYGTRTGGAAYAFTQFEPIYARQAFPCFDEPRFKTPFDITLTIPAGLTAISNTAVRTQTQLPGGQTRIAFGRTEKLPTYLVAVAVGPLDVVDAPPIPPNEARATALPLRGVAARGRGPELGFVLAETPRLLSSLERYFGVAYPYEKLDLIAVPDFASGAMENAGAITFRDTLLLMKEGAPEWQRRQSTSVNAHELAHQWFGNLVTMPWWDDIWLNEGFATWLASRVVDEVHPEYHQGYTRVAQLERAFDVDSKASARQVRQPIRSDHDIRNAFDAITYTKGGALLAMFERYLGPEVFRAGLRRYLERHRFGSGTSQDLLAALEESSGKPVAKAFSSFLDQPGVPSVAAELRCASGSPPRVHLSQHRYVPLGSSASRDGLWQVPVCLEYPAPGAAAGTRPTEQCTLLDAPEAELTLNASECPRWVLPNAHAAGYYRWALGAAEQAALLEQGYAALEPAERLSLLSSSEAAARAGAGSLEQLLGVVRKLGREPERELVQAALGVLSDLRESLLSESELPGYRRLVQELVAARQKQLGLFPSAREDGENRLLRPALVAALAFEARDPSLRRDLDRLGRAHLGMLADERLARLPSELIEAALGVAVQEGGLPVIERAVLALGASSDGIERGRLLGALGWNQNPELSPEVLELALSDQLRTNERLSPIFGQLRQSETRRAAAAWVERHFDALIARTGSEIGAQLTQVAGAFCDRESAEHAREFFTPRVEALTGGPRLLRLNLESTELCAAFADAHRASARAYFGSPSGS